MGVYIFKYNLMKAEFAKLSVTLFAEIKYVANFSMIIYVSTEQWQFEKKQTSNCMFFPDDKLHFLINNNIYKDSRKQFRNLNWCGLVIY